MGYDFTVLHQNLVSKFPLSPLVHAVAPQSASKLLLELAP